MRWFGHIEGMKSEEFVKKVYMSEIMGPNRSRRPLGRWKDRERSTCVRGVPLEGGGVEQVRRECLDRERWRFFCRGHSFVQQRE